MADQKRIEEAYGEGCRAAQEAKESLVAAVWLDFERLFPNLCDEAEAFDAGASDELGEIR
jgi:hypothetical protein